MTLRRRLTREEKQAETRARILEAATDVILAKGLDGASIDEITERAGFTRGAFYSNFSSKGELLIEVCSARMATHAALLIPQIEAAPPDRRTAEVVRLLDEHLDADHVVLLVELMRLGATDAQGYELVTRWMAAFTDVIAATFAAQAPDYGNPPADVRLSAARATVAAFLGLTLVRHLGQPADRDAAQFLLEGIGVAAFGDVARQDRGDDGAAP